MQIWQKIVYISVSFICGSLVPAYASLDMPAPGGVSMQSNWRQTVASLRPTHQPTILPLPRTTPSKPLHLSLREAILLALRNNPDVESSELQRVIDKFSLVVAHNHYMPQFSLGGAAVYARGAQPDYTINPGIELHTPIGTDIKATYTDEINGLSTGTSLGTTALTVTQPLFRGFGLAVNMAPWHDALDQEKINKLTFKSNIMSTVVQLISAYRQLVENYQQIDIQKRTLLRTEQQLKQNELKLKYGKAARSDVEQQKANYASTKVGMLKNITSLDQSYQNFLTVLGLNANATIIIDKKLPVEKVKIPSLDKCIALALKGNIPYQKALIGIKEKERAVMIAKNNAEWQLDLVANSSLNSLVHLNDPYRRSANLFDNTAPSIGFRFSVPINDVAAKQQIISAKIGLQQAQIQLAQAKAQLIRDITKKVKQLQNEQRTVQVSRTAVSLKQQTLKDAQIKLKYGRTTVFEVNTLQDALLEQETGLVQSEISLMNSVTDLNKQLGTTLKIWGVELRY